MQLVCMQHPANNADFDHMQIFEKGKCAGTTVKEVQKDGMLASVSEYDSDVFNASWHYHTNVRISFVLRGGCTEKKKSSYERLPGMVAFYLTGEPHRIMQIRRSVHVNLELENHFFNQYGISEQLFSDALSRTPDAKFMMLKVHKEMMEDDSFTTSSVQMLLLEFLNRSSARKEGKKLPAWIQVICELLHDRRDETLSLQDLSNATGIHPVTISHYFPKYFSCTLGEYMRKLKVDNALMLIKEGKTSLTNIGYECGFFDQSHFIRTFKRFTGYLPAKYQKL